MGINKQESIIERLLERAKNMPQPPLRYVLFLEETILPVALLKDPIVFEKNEFAIVHENYGYPSSASVVKNGVMFYLNDLKDDGVKFKVFIEEE